MLILLNHAHLQGIQIWRTQLKRQENDVLGFPPPPILLKKSKNVLRTQPFSKFSSLRFPEANPSGWGPHTGLPAILSAGAGLGPGWAPNAAPAHSHSLPFPTQNRYGAQVQPNSDASGRNSCPQTLPRPRYKASARLPSAHLTRSLSRLIQMLLAFLPSFPSSSKPPQIGFLNIYSW